MRILLSNDDGVAAAGLEALIGALDAAGHEVIVAAPMHEQSGMAHAISVHKRIEVARAKELEKKYDLEAWAIDGTPTDCVKIYLEAMQDQAKPIELVLSGINHGANLATDVLYSGTVGAALEGFLHNLSSAAVSLDKDSDLTFAKAAKFTADYLDKLTSKENTPFFYNINFPVNLADQKPNFVRATLGWRDYVNAFIKETDDDGREYFYIGGEVVDNDKDKPTDIWAVEQGYVSVTPLTVDWLDRVKFFAAGDPPGA